MWDRLFRKTKTKLPQISQGRAEWYVLRLKKLHLPIWLYPLMILAIPLMLIVMVTMFLLMIFAGIIVLIIILRPPRRVKTKLNEKFIEAEYRVEK